MGACLLVAFETLQGSWYAKSTAKESSCRDNQYEAEQQQDDAYFWRAQYASACIGILCRVREVKGSCCYQRADSAGTESLLSGRVENDEEENG
jgi:hypothetical protein